MFSLFMINIIILLQERNTWPNLSFLEIILLFTIEEKNQKP